MSDSDHLLSYLTESLVQPTVVFDPVGNFDNVQCCQNGCVSLMSRSTVHIFTCQHKYLNMFYDSWVSIQCKTAADQAEHVSLEKMLSTAVLNELRQVFRSQRWVRPLGSNQWYLACLLSSGAIVLLSCSKSGLQEVALTSGTDSLVTRDVSVDFQSDDSSLREIDKFEWIQRPGKSSNDLFVTIHNLDVGRSSIRFWQLISQDQQIRLLPTGQIVAELIPRTYLKLLPVRVRQVCLLNNERICVAFCHGALAIYQQKSGLDWSIERCSELRYRFINSVHVSHELLLIVSENSVLILRQDSLEIIHQKELHTSRITALLVFPTGNAQSVQFITSSFDGCTRSWQWDLGKGIALMFDFGSTIQQPIVGISTDCTGFAVILSHSLPRILESTREVQLNYGLAAEQTGFTLRASPSLLQSGWPLNCLGFSAELLYRLPELVDRPGSFAHVGNAFVDCVDFNKGKLHKTPTPLLPSGIREAARLVEDLDLNQYRRKKQRRSIKTELRDNGSEVDSDDEPFDDDDDGAAMNDECGDSGEEYPDEIPDSDDDQIIRGSKSSRKSPAPKKGSNSKSSSSAVNFDHGLTTAFLKLRDTMDPNPLSLALIALDALFDSMCLIGASLEQMNAPMFFENQEGAKSWLSGVENCPKDDLIASFYKMSEDLGLLRCKVITWQLFVAAARSILMSRCAALASSSEERRVHENRISQVDALIWRSRALFVVDKWINSVSGSEKLLSSGQFRRWCMIAAEIPSQLSRSLLDSIDFSPNQFKSDEKESCPICKSQVEFQPTNPGQSECFSCKCSIDRCHWTLSLIENFAAAQIVRCPLCQASYSTTVALDSSCTEYCAQCNVCLQSV